MNVCFSECVQMSVYVLMCTGVYLCGHVVMVNSICQLDWATRCSDVWLNVILGVSASMFLEETDI